jgi:hypothetical protein
VWHNDVMFYSRSMPLCGQDKYVVAIYPDREENFSYALKSDNSTKDASGIIMMFSGIEDRLGKPIFDGDVVQTYSYFGGIKNFKAKVFFEFGCFSIINQFGEKRTLSNYPCEVIGNIHETPDISIGD